MDCKAQRLLIQLVGEHYEKIYCNPNFYEFINNTSRIPMKNYFILILCNFSLNPKISDKTPDRAESITTLVILYK